MINPKTGLRFRDSLEFPSQTFEVSPLLLNTFADEFSEHVIEFRNEPFLLRAGGSSNYYVDGRGPLTMDLHRGILLAKLTLAKAFMMGFKFDCVAGMGVGGTAYVLNINSVGGLLMVQANDCQDEDQRYGYGLHGAPVDGRNVLVVDDTLTSGDSLGTTIQMVQDAGGHVPYAAVAVDRSIEGARDKLSEQFNTHVDALFYFTESDGRVFPNI